MELPKEKTTAIKSLDKFTMLLFGQPKIGKTTLASHFPDTIFLATEPGHRFLELWKLDIKSWDDFLEAGALIINSQYKTVVIDTVDNLFKLCEDFCCKKWDIEHPGDLGYGKGWSILKSEFQRAMLKFVGSGLNFLFISHQKEQEVKSRVIAYTKITNTLTESARKVLLPIVDIIAYLGTESVKDKDGNIINEEHVLITKAGPSLEVGARGNPSYKFPEKIIIPDPAKANGYEAIIQAIKQVNKQ